MPPKRKTPAKSKATPKRKTPSKTGTGTGRGGNPRNRGSKDVPATRRRDAEGKPKRVTPVMAEKGFQAFAVRGEYADAGRAMDVHVSTAKRLALEGDKKLKIEAWSTRLARVQREAADANDETLKEVLAKVDKAAGGLLALLTLRLSDIIKRAQRVRPGQVLPKDLATDLAALPIGAKELDTLARLRVFIRGGADRRFSITQDTAGEFPGWSVDQLRAFVTDGEIPEEEKPG